MKPLVEELENKIGNSNQEQFDADGVRRKNEMNQKKKKAPKKSKKDPADQGTNSRRRRQASSQVEEDSMEVEE